MHLAGEADAGNGLMGRGSGIDGAANGDQGSAPPVFRILLGPAGMRRAKGCMIFRGGADNASLLVHQHRAGAACAHIHTQEPHCSTAFLNRFSSIAHCCAGQHSRVWLERKRLVKMRQYNDSDLPDVTGVLSELRKRGENGFEAGWACRENIP